MSFDLDNLRQKIAQHGSVMRIVVVATKGSAPRGAGTEMLVWDDGQDGTIGGGALEFSAVARARTGAFIDTIPLGPNLNQCCGGAVSLIAERWDAEKLQDIHKSTTRRLSGDLPCPLSIRRAMRTLRNANGTPEILFQDGWLFETITFPTRPIWIYGAGHVGQALVNTMAPLPQTSITWVDTSDDRFPADLPQNVDKLIAQDPAAVAKYAPADATHLILTYSHAFDLAICHALLGHRADFVGLIGSRTKWARFQNRLRDLGWDANSISRITCPIGDPALGKHPQQIAISVAHQLTEIWARAPKKLELTA